MSWTREKKILPRRQPEMDYREEIRFLLIEAGVVGMKQSVLVKRFENWKSAAEVKAELEFLEVQQKVHRFKMKSEGGRPATIWRATTRILEQ